MGQINLKKTDNPELPASGKLGLFPALSGQWKAVDDEGNESLLAGIGEAPIDGQKYVRKDEVWVPADGGGIASVQEGTGIEVDETDPDNPIVKISTATLAAIAEGVEAHSWGNHASAGYLTSAPYPAAVHRQNNTVLFDKDYIHDPAVAAQTGNILFDFTGAQLGATTSQIHDNSGAYTFPSEGQIKDFETTKLALVTGDVTFGYTLIRATPSSEVVEIRVSLTESQLAEYNA